MPIPTCIFAKPPVPGDVKTRLIPVLGPQASADLARAMLQDVWSSVESCSAARPVLATTARGDLPVSVPLHDVWLQGTGDLGRRIERILSRALMDAPAAIAIGADSPAFSKAHLELAIQALQTHDAVIGPALDGGFYLLALRRCPAGLFSSLPWSAPDTLRALQQRIAEHRWSVAELEPLFDVDTHPDLLLLEEHLIAHPASAPATRAWYFQNRCASAS